MAGTGHYMAPEVVDGKYSKACDLWAIGVTLYYLLFGKFPFDGPTIDAVFSKIRKGTF